MSFASPGPESAHFSPEAPLDPQPQLAADPQPQLSANDLLAQLHGKFERLCREVADAVNQAPVGQVIHASEEKVRDLFGVFRKDTYQAAVQLRLDAAQAAFPPSAAPADREVPPGQGA